MASIAKKPTTMARVAMLTLVVAALAAVVVVASAAQDELPATPALPSLPTIPGTPPGMMPRNLTCTSTLMGCMLYYQNMTADDPFDSLEYICCAPARKVLDGDMSCLCDGLNNPELITYIDLDVKKGMGMFPRCGVKLPNNVCSGSNAGGPAQKSRNGASQGTRFSYPSFLVFFLFAMWPLLP